MGQISTPSHHHVYAAIINLKLQLDSLVYDEKKDFSVHVNKFLAICDELASYGEEIDQKDKSSKLIRSLPPSFSALAMVTSVTETSFDKIAEAVKAELARRSNPNNPQSRNTTQSSAQAFFAQTFQTIGARGGQGHWRSSGRGRWRGRGYRESSSRGRGGHYNRHYSNDRQSGEGEGRVMPCFYCGKPGHFIRTCLIKQADERSGRISKPRRGGYRGSGGDRQYFGNQSRPWSHRGSQDMNWNPRGLNQSRRDADDFDSPAVNHTLLPFGSNRNPDNSRFDDPQAHYRANHVRFRSSLAKISEPKQRRALIDSEATHNFFYDKSMFTDHTPIAKRERCSGIRNDPYLGQRFR